MDCGYIQVADELVAEFADPINGVSTPDQVFSLYKLFKTECKINIMDLFFRVNI